MPKPLHTRTRPTSTTLRGEHRYERNGVLLEHYTNELEIKGRQITVSEGHHWPPPKGGRFNDVGGPFYTQKTYVEGNPSIKANLVLPASNGRVYKYTGDLFPHPIPFNSGPEPYFPPDVSSSDETLEEAGTTAIARCKPTNSNADVGTALGELYKEGLPSLPLSRTWKDRTARARNSGGEYLNAQFGWNPLVNEITNFGETIRHSDRILTQYERDAGKLVRRRYRFPTEKGYSIHKESDQSAAFAKHYPVFTESTSLGTLTRAVETTRKVTFSGAFTYGMPFGLESRKGIAGLAADADVLFGVSPTPELFWELAPWSWAVDWFTNTGDVISNISDYVTHGLVLRYGYITEHTVTKCIYQLDRTGLKAQFPQVVPPLVLVRETKKRIPATPFGFGLTWDGFSPFQVSILAALGISRSR